VPVISETEVTAPGGAPVSKVLGALVRLSLPIAFVQVGLSLMGFVDAAMAGRIDELALGATGLGTSIFFVVSIVALGLVLGIDPLTSQAFGAGRPRQARQIVWQGLYAAAFISVPCVAITAVLATQLESFGVVPELAVQARGYILARIPSLVPFLAIVALRAYLQSAHATRAVVLSTIAANVVNFVFNGLLGFGDEALTMVGLPAVGLPALGVVGLALASSIAALAQMVVLALAVRGVAMGEGTEPVRALNLPTVRTLLRLGWPIALTLLAEIGVFVLVQVLIAGMAVHAAAAHQVALQFASLSFSVCLGVGSATSVQVGRAIGAGDAPLARRAGLLGIGLGAGFMLAPGVIMGWWPGLLLPLMTSDLDVVPLAARLMRIAAVFQLADGVQAVAGGALRGAGVTRWAFIANLVSHWGIGLPVGLVLAYQGGLGAIGLWWGLTVGLVVVAVAMSLRFNQVTRRGVGAIHIA
jgi:multidrug resistance protein, MATE family